MRNKLIPLLLALLGFVLTGCPKTMYDTVPTDFKVKEKAEYVEPEPVFEDAVAVPEEAIPEKAEENEE